MFIYMLEFGKIMKVNLIFPPFVFPLSPPIGIAYLKSYLQKEMPSADVTCYDLNHYFHEIVYETVKNKEHKNEKEKAFLETRKYFTEISQEFFDKTKYHQNANLFKSVFEAFYAKYNQIFKDILEGKHLKCSVLKKFIDKILQNKPDVIGISVCYLEQWYPSLVLGALLKQVSDAKIVFGGSFLITDAERKFTTKAMDYMIIGEGELAFKKLLENIDTPEKVPNLIFEKEKIIRNEQKAIGDLAEIPHPNYSDLPKKYYTPKKVVPILASRGCYWKRCAFCTHYKSYDLRYRIRPLDDILDEIKKYYNRGERYFYFVDEMLSAYNFREISKKIVEEKLDIRFLALAKPTRDFTQEILDVMHKAGCRMIIWGFEAGNQRVLDLINKGTNVEDMKNVFERAEKAGIQNHLYLIVGFPTETEEEFKDTVTFLEENKKNIASIHKGPFMLCKDSPVFDNPEQYGITKIYDKEQVRTNYKYEVKSGINEAKKTEVFQKNVEYFDSFNKFSFHLNSFREHAIIIYDKTKVNFK